MDNVYFGKVWCLERTDFWLIGRTPKSLCNHELSVIIIVIIVVSVVVVICDQLSQVIWLSLNTKDVPSLHVVTLSYSFTSTKVHLACTRNISFETCSIVIGTPENLKVC